MSRTIQGKAMAIVFELSVHFGAEEAAARLFMERMAERYCPLAAGPHRIELHPPLLSSLRDGRGDAGFEVSVIPIAVGYAVGLDRDRPRLRLTPDELTQLAGGLYDLLRGLDPYPLALVGWDADRFDLAEVQSEYREEVMDGTLHGLVIAHELRPTLPPSPHFVPFDDGHDWIPYRGDRT